MEKWQSVLPFAVTAGHVPSREPGHGTVASVPTIFSLFELYLHEVMLYSEVAWRLIMNLLPFISLYLFVITNSLSFNFMYVFFFWFNNLTNNLSGDEVIIFSCTKIIIAVLEDWDFGISWVISSGSGGPNDAEAARE